MKKMLYALLIWVITFSFCEKQEPKKQDGPVSKETSQFQGIKDLELNGWEPGKPGGRFVRAQFGGDPKTFNPIVMAETTTMDVLRLLFPFLARRNQMTLAWEPCLARSWEIAENNLSIIFHLRNDLKWSDGVPLTAEDFVYTVNTIIHNKKIQTNQRDGQFISGKPAVWEAIDAYTLKITVPEVYAGLFDLSSITPVPKHIFKPLIDSKGIDAVNSFWGVDSDVSKIIGCGPFVIANYVPSQKITFKPNPYYYEKDEQGQALPYLQEVTYVFVEDQDTELNKFLAREIDLYSLRGEDYAVLIDKKKELNFELYNVGPAASSTYLGFNMNYKSDDSKGLESPLVDWLNQKKLRQAFCHLIDRNTIINNIAYGFGYPQYSIISKASPFCWEGQEQVSAPYSPEKAKQLLDELGYVDKNGDGIREDENGKKISILLNTNSGNKVREALGENITQEAKKVGIELIFKPIDFNTLIGKINTTSDWEMIIMGFTGGPDPVTMANIIPSRGYLHVNDPAQTAPKREWEKHLDTYWREANNTLDAEQRKAGFEKIQRLWIDENPWIYTFNTAMIYAVRNSYGNIKPRPFNDYHWLGCIARMYVKSEN